MVMLQLLLDEKVYIINIILYFIIQLLIIYIYI
jgi:hypothetical protein